PERRDTSLRPLPAPTGKKPYHLDLADVLHPKQIKQIKERGAISFHTFGDSGNKAGNHPSQFIVTTKIEEDLHNNRGKHTEPSFLYHLGDIVYFNGEEQEFYSQFYHPYEHYLPPILAIPGNHDAENFGPHTDSLKPFVKHF